MVIVDESQNSRQSWSLQQGRLECALFNDKSQGKLRDAAKKFCDQHSLQLPISGILNQLNKPLRDIAALYVEVTATPEPTLLVEPGSKAQILKCKINQDYYGFWKQVHLNRCFIYGCFPCRRDMNSLLCRRDLNSLFYSLMLLAKSKSRVSMRYHA